MDSGKSKQVKPGPDPKKKVKFAEEKPKSGTVVPKPVRLQDIEKGCCSRCNQDPQEIRGIKFEDSALESIGNLIDTYGGTTESLLTLVDLIVEGMRLTVDDVNVFIKDFAYKVNNPKELPKNLADNQSSWQYASNPGLYIWMLTYTTQFLKGTPSNTPNKDDNDQMTAEERSKAKKSKYLDEIRKGYEKLGEISQLLSELGDLFYVQASGTRGYMYYAVKKLIKKWKLNKKSFGLQSYKEPITDDEINFATLRLSVMRESDVDPEELLKLRNKAMGKNVKTKSTAASSSGAKLASNEEEEDDLIQLNLPSQAVLLQSRPGGNWTDFTGLSHEQRADVVNVFTKELVTMTQRNIDQLSSVKKNLEHVNQTSEGPASSILELSAAFYRIVKSSKIRKLIKPDYLNSKSGKTKQVRNKEKEQIGERILRLWLWAEKLYRVVYKAKELMSEFRDSVRSCYYYMISFYKWPLNHCHIIQSDDSSAEEKKKMSKFLKVVYGPTLNKPKKPKKEVDLRIIYALTDFSSIYYQQLLIITPITASGAALKLQGKQKPEFEEKEETWGLLYMTDSRTDKARYGKKIERLKFEDD